MQAAPPLDADHVAIDSAPDNSHAAVPIRFHLACSPKAVAAGHAWDNSAARGKQLVCRDSSGDVVVQEA
jgi:hypothetical protein